MATESFGVIGADYDNPASGKTFQPGECTHGDDRSKWVYVEAGSAISQYQAVAIDEQDSYKAFPATNAMQADNWPIGVASVAFTKGQSGWVQVEGYALARVASGTSIESALKVGGTAGLLAATTSGANYIAGLVNTSASTSDTGGTSVNLKSTTAILV